MGHPAHFARREDPFVQLAASLSTALRRPGYSSGSNGYRGKTNSSLEPPRLR
jgi:hypothetical protein